MKNFGKFSVIFTLVLSSFSATNCTTGKLIWCTSSGIISYDRRNGVFEMTWDRTYKQDNSVSDTIYIHNDSIRNQYPNPKR